MPLSLFLAVSENNICPSGLYSVCQITDLTFGGCLCRASEGQCGKEWKEGSAEVHGLDNVVCGWPLDVVILVIHHAFNHHLTGGLFRESCDLDRYACNWVGESRHPIGFPNPSHKKYPEWGISLAMS